MDRPKEHPLDFRYYEGHVLASLPEGAAGQLLKSWLISDLRIEWPVE